MMIGACCLPTKFRQSRCEVAHLHPDGALYVITSNGTLRRYSGSYSSPTAWPLCGPPAFQRSIAANQSGELLARRIRRHPAFDILNAKSLNVQRSVPMSNARGGLNTVSWLGTSVVYGGAASAPRETMVCSNGMPVPDPQATTVWSGTDAIMTSVACGAYIAAASGDPGIAVIGADDNVAFAKPRPGADMRDKLGEAFTCRLTVRASASGLGLGATDPVVFDLKGSDQLRDGSSKDDDLRPPRVDTLPVSN